MSFLAPLMLIGALGAAIPIAIHLFGRARAKRVRFAAVSFLLGSDRKLAARLRLREQLVLLVRVLVCISIALAMAKPFTSCQSSGPAVERGPQGAVLIIDNSLAGRYHIGGSTLVARAKDSARAVLRELGPEADVAILTLAEGATQAGELSRDHLRLQSALDDIKAGSRAPDLESTLRRAGQLLIGSSHARRTVFVFSAFAATGAVEKLPWAEEAGIEVRWVALAEDEKFENTAVISVAVRSDPSAGTRGIRVDAEVANYSATPAERELTLEIDGDPVASLEVALPPGAVKKKRFSTVIPEGKRSANIAVSLTRDALPNDDRRHVVAQLRDEIRVLLVNGDPRTVRHEDELFYLQAALQPGGQVQTGLVVTRTTPDMLAKTALDSFDVVFLANIPAPESKVVTSLLEWIENGGGLFIALGDQVNAEAYNQKMAALLPQKLSAVVDATYGARGAESDTKAERLAKLEANHPVFKLFGTAGQGLRQAKFDKLVLLGPTSQIEKRRILARYENGAAALVEGGLGQGTIFLLTSSLDRDWNDLCIQPGFLPFVQQSARYLAKRQLSSAEDQIFVGRTAIIAVSEGDTRLRVRGPRGRETVFEADRLRKREQVRFAETPHTGVYQVFATDKSGKSQSRPQSNFAVNIDPSLSKLERTQVSDLPTGSTKQGTANPTRRRIELWHAIGAGLLLLLLMESLLLVRRR